jgi:hypothetical protein
MQTKDGFKRVVAKSIGKFSVWALTLAIPCRVSNKQPEGSKRAALWAASPSQASCAEFKGKPKLKVNSER